MKNKLLTFAIAATFLKLLFIPQFVFAQNTRFWATYYGGAKGATSNSVATDASGNVYMAGTTASTDSIAWRGFQDTLGRFSDAFLVKFDAGGNRLWATYYGGTLGTSTFGFSVATDASGNVYLAGQTDSSTNLASGGFQDSLGGKNGNAFLVKFDSAGNRLWATYYGGALGTFGSSIATDAAGNIFLAGGTADSTGIASRGFQNTYGGGAGFSYYHESSVLAGGDAFLVKFDAYGNRLWATYYGGAGNESANSVATDASGNVYLAGTTNSYSGIAWAGFQTNFGGTNDAFLVKFDAYGNRLWATYYGGLYNESGYGVATDASGNVYLAGTTASNTNIASGGFQNTYGGGSTLNGGDAFLVKFDGGGNRLWATYYGGQYDDFGFSVATDSAGNVWLAGTTNSDNNIASGGFQDSLTYGGGQNKPFLVMFAANGNRKCATYYGGTHGLKTGYAGVALDNTGHVYLASYTYDSTGIASGGFQNTYDGTGNDGAYDAFLVKFCPCSNCIIIPVSNFQSSDTAFCTNECINYTDSSTNVTSWQWSFPGGTPSSSTIQNPQGICYNTSGNYDVKLIASNGIGSDTLTSVNYIKVFPTPPTPVITQHHDTLICTTDPTYTSYQWYDSTTLIPGATDTFLIITHGGNYNVAVTNEFGFKISVGITIAHDVGINEFSATNYISLYPNPATNELLISGNWKSGAGKGKLTIVNLIGETIYTKEINRQSEIINCKPFPAGIYFVRVENQSGRWVGRFVKE